MFKLADFDNSAAIEVIYFRYVSRSIMFEYDNEFDNVMRESGDKRTDSKGSNKKSVNFMIIIDENLFQSVDSF